MMSIQTSTEGDPGKLEYLHNANWTPTPMIHGIKPDPRLCPGCLFNAPKWPHVDDVRCELWRRSHATHGGKQ
jgi:hypothetical protein